MKTRSAYKLSSLLALAILSYATVATAQITLYNDVQSGIDNDYFNTGSAEIGNDVTLYNGAHENTTNLPNVFNLSYFFFAPSGTNGTETAELRIYETNGAAISGAPSPGTEIYDSGAFSLAAFVTTGTSTMQFLLGAGGGNAMNLSIATNDYIWTIQFNNINGTESAGLTINDPAETGMNYPTYWQKTNGMWYLLEVNPGDPSNNDNSDFGAEIFAAANPTITWGTPSPITQGTPLSGTQLDASTGASGTLTYNPPSGTVLSAGTQSLQVIFTPSNPLDYNSATDYVSLVVIPAPAAAGEPLLPEWAVAAFTILLIGFGLERVHSLRGAASK